MRCKTIKDLDESKGRGPDSIPPGTVKYCCQLRISSRYVIQQVFIRFVSSPGWRSVLYCRLSVISRKYWKSFEFDWDVLGVSDTAALDSALSLHD
ncbi:hypothetical protein J6590_006988 [Homalodisca vitripennis]|nr:hypothetical protein J6590_006988 [Homalodisca vitripennis]